MTCALHSHAPGGRGGRNIATAEYDIDDWMTDETEETCGSEGN
jgi:hypothetical protein